MGGAAVALAFIAALWALPSVAAESGESADAAWRRAVALSQSVIGKPVADHAFTDSDGRRVTLADYRGKPLLVSFVYTSCSQVCPTTTRFLEKAVKQAQEALGRDAFAVITVGFNVPFDSPQAMAAFSRKQGIRVPNWRFLSPDPAGIDTLIAETGFSYTRNAGGFDHITQVTILDGEGRVYRQVYGEEFELPMLIGPLKELLTGNAAPPPQDFSGWIERVRLYCTVYDPASGKYRFNYGVIIEILAGLSLMIATLWYLISGRRR